MYVYKKKNHRYCYKRTISVSFCFSSVFISKTRIRLIHNSRDESSDRWSGIYYANYYVYTYARRDTTPTKLYRTTENRETEEKSNVFGSSSAFLGRKNELK